MKKEEILSLWNHKEKEWVVEENGFVGREIRTGIPVSDGNWETVRFYNFTEQEVCDMLDRDFVMQLKEKLPALIEQAYHFAIAQTPVKSYEHGRIVMDFCDVVFRKNQQNSFFMLEFDAGDNPDEFQSEYMLSVCYDRNFRLTGEITIESIWR